MVYKYILGPDYYLGVSLYDLKFRYPKHNFHNFSKNSNFLPIRIPYFHYFTSAKLLTDTLRMVYGLIHFIHFGYKLNIRRK